MSSCFLILANNNYTYIYIMKNSAHILGLDLGTNSVGWALLNANQFRIAGNGSRIIPMTGDVILPRENCNRPLRSERLFAMCVKTLSA